MDDVDKTLKSPKNKIIEHEELRVKPINDIVEEIRGGLFQIEG